MRKISPQRRSNLQNVGTQQVLRCHNLEDHNFHIRPDLKEQVYEGVNWIQVAHDITQWHGYCEHSDDSLSSVQGGEILDQLRLSS
jgi:hypothetical protein